MVAMGLLVEGQRYTAGRADAWFIGAIALGLLLGFCAIVLEGRPRRVATHGSLYLLLGAPVLIFVGVVGEAAGWW